MIPPFENALAALSMSALLGLALCALVDWLKRVTVPRGVCWCP